MIEGLEQIIREIHGTVEDNDAPFASYLSSFEIMVLLSRIESRFDVKLPYSVLQQNDSLNKLSDYLYRISDD